VIALSIAALVTPAVAAASLPSKGQWWNHSQSSGLYMVTSHHTVKTLWLFCKAKYDPQHAEFREARYQVRDLLPVKSDGSFSYHGTADRYGPEGQPLGRWKIRLKGRFTSPSRVKIKRTLQGCGPTLTATAKRG
jgi:hypothetical protein